MIGRSYSLTRSPRLSSIAISDRLPRYTEYNPLVPVWCVTPRTPRTIHRYFDNSPFSPSGRYLVSTQLSNEDRLPVPGDIARIIVTDLTTGDEQCVAETRGWDTQVGAHPQWGTDDRQLYFNDIDTTAWRPFGVRLDLQNGSKTCLEGTIYAVSRDGRLAISPCLRRTGLVQAGYGVIVPSEFVPQTLDLADDDGIFVTDLVSGKQRLLISMRALVQSMKSPYGRRDNEAGMLVGFHLNWNPQADRILFILRWIRLPARDLAVILELRRHFSRGVRKLARIFQLRWLQGALAMPQMVANSLIVMRSDGTEPQVVIPSDMYARGGHHPNWCVDGRSILMNLHLNGQMRFVRIHPDENRIDVLSDTILGTGHPTLHPHGRYIVSDAYPFEPVAYGDGTVPIRLVDWAAGSERALVRISTRPAFSGRKSELRIDPHPAWDRSFQRLAFNAAPDGTRRVYVADLTKLAL